MLQSNEQLSIVVIDDHPIVLEGIRKLLLREFNNCQLQEFTNGLSFLTYLKTDGIHIHLVLLDVSLPDKSGIEICREIKTYSPNTCVLAFSNHSDRSIIMQMMQNGTSGYILKNVGAPELIACIKEALNGKIVFSREVNEIISQPSTATLKTIPSLTKREKQILQMVVDGKTSLVIAQELNVSPLTVETHRRNIMEKFDVRNVAALIKAAIQHHILQ